MPSRSTPTLAVPEPIVAGSASRRRWFGAAAEAAAEASALAPVQALRPALRSDRETVLAEVLQALPVALVRFESDGTIDIANERAAQLLQALGLGPALRNGWVLLEALDAPLARRARAALRQPGVLAERRRVFVRPAGRAPVELALGVQVLGDRACLLTLEEAWASSLRPTVG